MALGSMEGLGRTWLIEEEGEKGHGEATGNSRCLCDKRCAVAATPAAFGCQVAEMTPYFRIAGFRIVEHGGALRSNRFPMVNELVGEDDSDKRWVVKNTTVHHDLRRSRAVGGLVLGACSVSAE